MQSKTETTYRKGFKFDPSKYRPTTTSGLSFWEAFSWSAYSS